MAKQNSLQKFITNNYGPRRNMNGAGSGGRLVARRDKKTGKVAGGKSQLGNRDQRRRDLRAAFGLATG